MNWVLREIGYSKEDIDYCGNKFLMGNGYLGVRASLDEYSSEERACINLAGVYDRNGDKWRESVNAPNGLWISLKVNGKELGLPSNEPLYHEQWLDIRNAVQGRKTVWQLPKGKVTVISERFASMSDIHTLFVKYSVETDFDAEIELLSGIDAEIWDIFGPHFSDMKLYEESNLIVARGVTLEKGITVKVCESVKSDTLKCNETLISEKRIAHKFSYTSNKGQKAEFEKCLHISTSCDAGYPFDFVPSMYNTAFAKHSAEWDKIWDKSQVVIDGDDDAMLALNYSIYHLNIIAPRHSESMSIPARGLSGQVYKGAIFWDTEMFMFDYFLYTEPKVARTLLRYRIDTLSGALEKARSYGFDGAFYAWESQEGGFDACSEYNITDVFTKRPIRTYFRDKQVHVSSAVAYALMKYIDVTNDRSLLEEGGAKMLIECAKFYYSLLLKRADSDYFEIHDVVGPDEYHERVNNDAYTNKMAQFTISKAAEIIREIKENDICNELSLEYNLSALENKFSLAAEKIFVPTAKDNNLIQQFDGYFKLEDASVETVRSRLLDPREYWGGANGVATHTQVNKQADVIAMISMFPQDYSEEVTEANWDYYEPRTEHGSSLSACMFAITASRIGRPEKAYPLFMKSASADLMRGGKLWAGLTFIGGTHPAASGGAWKVAVQGFSALTVKDGKIVAQTPHLPDCWKSMSYKVKCGENWYSVTSTHEKTVVEEICCD